MNIKKRPGETLYVGKPSPEIDLAWKRLLNGTACYSDSLATLSDERLTGTHAGSNIALEEKDAKGLIGHTYVTKTGKYATGLDVFHQLHCLVSTVRQSRRPG